MKTPALNFLPILLSFVLLFANCNQEDTAEKDLSLFIENYEKTIKPLNKEYKLSSFNASVNGKEDDYKKSADLKIMIVKILSNNENFKKLKDWRKNENIKDPLLKRQLDLLYFKFLPYQVDEVKMVNLIMDEN